MIWNRYSLVILFIKNRDRLGKSKLRPKGSSVLEFKKTLLFATAVLGLTLATPAFASEASDQLAAAQTAIQTTESQLATLTEEEESLSQQLAGITTDQSELNRSITEMTAELADKNQELTKLQETYADQAGDLFAFLQNKQGATQEEITAIESQIQDLRYDLVVAQGQQETLAAQLETGKAQQTKLQTDQKSAQEQITTKTQEAQQLTETVKEEEAKAAKTAATGYASPLNIGLNVSSPFGMRENPLTGGSQQHDGIDLTGGLGEPVLAARDGIVEIAGTDPSAGNYVIVKHDNGMYSYYLHLNGITVSQGQTVAVRDQVGEMGTTGDSTGVHLHFGLASSSSWSGFVDPAPLLGI